jgi:hypothetical protein
MHGASKFIVQSSKSMSLPTISFFRWNFMAGPWCRRWNNTSGISDTVVVAGWLLQDRQDACALSNTRGHNPNGTWASGSSILHIKSFFHQTVYFQVAILEHRLLYWYPRLLGTPSKEEENAQIGRVAWDVPGGASKLRCPSCVLIGFLVGEFP